VKQDPLLGIEYLLAIIFTGCIIIALYLKIEEWNYKPNVLECPRPKICEDKP
jgi:hypothetical protein